MAKQWNLSEFERGMIADARLMIYSVSEIWVPFNILEEGISTHHG